MTDSQSWPLSLQGFEDLAEQGAYSEIEIYDEADIKEIVTYAAEVSNEWVLRQSYLPWAKPLCSAGST